MELLFNKKFNPYRKLGERDTTELLPWSRDSRREGTTSLIPLASKSAQIEEVR
jgi:hypothetical protein